jgi:LPS O-antigen subunit length determinant protein (WzzB/FepE family)
LLSKFIAELESRQTIEATIASTDYLEQQADETDDEFGLRIRQATYGFELEAPSLATKNTSKTQWTLKILTGKPKLAKIIVADALELANQKISNELLKSFERLQNEHARTIKFGLEDLAFEYERAQAKYQSTVDNQLALLKEQASLARTLDIKKRSLFTETYSNTSETNSSVGASSLSTVNTDAPTYLRGYIALEKEFDTLDTRKNPENFIPGLVGIENARLILLQDTKIKRARYLMALTPIGSDVFTAVTYDIASLNFTSNQKTSLVLALSLVLGGMLGVFLLMIRNVLINKV